MKCYKQHTQLKHKTAEKERKEKIQVKKIENSKMVNISQTIYVIK